MGIIVGVKIVVESVSYYFVGSIRIGESRYMIIYLLCCVLRFTDATQPWKSAMR